MIPIPSHADLSEIVICGIWRTLCDNPFCVFVYYDINTDTVIKLKDNVFNKEILPKYILKKSFRFDEELVFKRYLEFVDDLGLIYDEALPRESKNPKKKKEELVMLLIL
jgi:hypothetical protein